MRWCVLVVLGSLIVSPHPLAAQRAVESADLLRIREVTDPQLSPDGEWVAYTVSTSRHGRRRSRLRHLDVELGRRPQHPPHPDQAPGAHSALEP